MRVPGSAWTLVLVLLASGCLPSSCQRTTSRDISPADSVSRQIAETTPIDTLRALAELSGTEEERLEYPRTVLFRSHDELVVSDAQRNSIFNFRSDGTLLREITWEGASVPYLVGVFGDTTVAFSPGAHRVDYLIGSTVWRTVDTGDGIEESALQYMVATPSTIFLKVTGKDVPARLAKLRLDGSTEAMLSLGGDEWRQAGPLRIRGDSLLSFTGFYPLVDRYPVSLRQAPDSLMLMGFDSPMLSRTYAFGQGKGRGAPLLLSSATTAGPYIFVLNLRPGWLQIDAYDMNGRLQRILIEPVPGYNREFYAIDLAVHRQSADDYLFAVAVIEPRPVVRLFAWTSDTD